MNNLRKKVIAYAMGAVFLLLTVLLGVLNGIDFTLAAEDADRVTQMIADGRGQLQPGRIDPNGPPAPELSASARYFTVAFDKDGNAQVVALKVLAADRDAAIAWADSLRSESTGWTKTTYRYRVYPVEQKTYVTVVDQSRELIAPYRILKNSLAGEAVFLLICFFVLLFVSRRLLAPLEEADRKQKRFLADVEKEFQVPLTVMSAGTELIEKEHGANDVTRAMRRQVKRMTALVRELASLTVEGGKKFTYSLTDLCNRLIDAAQTDFAQRNLQVTANIAPGVIRTGDNEAMRRAIAELLENQKKFAKTRASVSLTQAQDRILLVFENDADLPDGSVEQVFDRFTRLENADGISGAGLGLSYVKEIVKQQDGRVSAAVQNGSFTVKISL